jgi:hypothetical protein
VSLGDIHEEDSARHHESAWGWAGCVACVRGGRHQAFGRRHLQGSLHSDPEFSVITDDSVGDLDDYNAIEIGIGTNITF